MMKSFAIFLLPFVLSFTAIWADAPSLLSPEEGEELIVRNRILAKVNGKTISVIDLMKKMDLYLESYYPHLAHSTVARYQFYSSQWRDMLAQMVDQELMLADAERLELKVTDAEVREEMLQRFGPTIMATLDKVGMTYEEARQMIHTEMVVARMLWFRVNSKALNQVNPQDIKEAYKQFCSDNPSLEQWEYRVLSLRSANRELSAVLAQRAFDLLHTAHSDLTRIADQIKEELPPENEMAITLSPDLSGDEKSLAQSHKEVLQTLDVGSYSAPIPQVSRSDNTIVYRIFHLKNHSKKETPPFEKMADQLKDDLLQKAASKENIHYLVKLRERMSYDEKQMFEICPDDFEPFMLR